MKQLLFILLIAVLASCSTDKFVKVKDTSFVVGGKEYRYLGTNYWYGVNLASSGPGGNRERLLRELDLLKQYGITNLRIMAGTEGPDNEPYRIVPSWQTSPGKYNPDQDDALDFLLNEMQKRDMRAVVCLSNFWNWSGGIPQYIVWSGAADSIPYPPPHPGGNWPKFQDFIATFYTNSKAVELLNNHIRYVVTRKNAYSGKLYIDDPTIMSWELANEPRGVNNIDAYRNWLNATAKFIKSLDRNHLVTTGSEGQTISTSAGTEPYTDHASPDIDYMTVHLWVENWGVYDPAKPGETFDKSIAYAREYIKQHKDIALKLNKPMVLEEFGIGRDSASFEWSAPTTLRDKYYSSVFDAVLQENKDGKAAIQGINFWAWGGEGRARKAKDMWKPGDEFIGDPPHEGQGWYSVYNTDSTTLSIIRDAAQKMKPE